MNWLMLVAAGLFEVLWAIGLKHTDGWSKLWPSLFTLAALVASFQLLSLALRNIPLGTAYAVWTGIGAVGVAMVGMIWFDEPRTFLRIACIALIVLGIVGLKVFGDAQATG